MLSACTMMFSSCDKAGESVDVAKTDAEFSLSSASEVSFSNGDAIGVFAFEDQKSYAENAKYLYLNGDFKSSTPMKVGEEDLRYVATSPYVDGAKSQFTFTVAEDQSKEKDLEKSALSLALNNMGTALSFEPAMALLEFKVPMSLKDGDLTVSAAGSIDCDLAAGTTSTSSSSMDIVAFADSKSYSVVVAPQEFEAGDDFLSLSVNGETYSCEVKDDFSVAAGESVSFSLKASGSDLSYVAGGSAEDGLFSIELVSTTHCDITIDVTPNDFDGNFFVGVTPVVYFESEFGGDPKLMAESTIYELNSQANGQIDWGTPNGGFLFNDYARIALGTVGWALYPEVDYVAFAVGVSSTGSVITDVSSLVVTTDEVDKVKPVEISLESATDTNIIVNATPGTNDPYMVVSIDKANYEGLGYTEADIADFAQAGIDFLYQGIQGFDPSVADNQFVFKGDATVDLSISWNQVFPILPSTDYYVLAFSVSNDGFVKSEVNYIEVSTKDEEKVEGSISLEVASVDQFSIKVNTKFEGNIGRYMIIPFPKEMIEGFDYETSFMASIEQLITDAQGSISLVKADGFYVLDEEVSDFDLSKGWLIDPATDYVILAAGVYANGELSTDLVTVETTTSDFTEDQKASYNKWLGTWKMTSTTADIAKEPLTVEVVIAPDEEGKTYQIYGWDTSAVRWIVGCPAAFDIETGGWSVMNENYMTYADEAQTQILVYGSISYIGGQYNDYYFVQGDYPSFTSTIISDATGTVIPYDGMLDDNATAFTPATMLMYVIDATTGDILGTYAPDETLGFAEGELMEGPFTMKKISDETSNDEMDQYKNAPAKAMAQQSSYFNIVDRVVNNAIMFNANVAPALNKVSPVVAEKKAKVETVKISGDVASMRFSRKASFEVK